MVIHRRGLRPTSAGWRPRFVLFDVVWAGLSALLAFWLRNPETFLTPESQRNTLIYVAISFLVTPLVFAWAGIGEDMSRYFSGREARGIIAASAFAAAIVAVTDFVLFRLDNAPRSVPVLHFLVLASGIMFGRALARLRQNRRDGKYARDGEVEHILIVGASRLTSFYLRMIDELAPATHRPLAIFDDKQALAGRSIAGCPIVGPPTDIPRVISEYEVHGVKIDRIVVTKPFDALSQGGRETLASLAASGVLVQPLDAQLFVAPSSAARQVTFAQTPEIVDERRELIARPYWMVKRGIDIVLSATLLVALLPLAVFVALLTLLNVGYPVLFWQRRVGKGGQGILVSKFRTLRAPFDSRGVRRTDTQRLDGVGRFVRATRLDEIPQLLCILSGVMSIIGPRPLLPHDQPDSIGLRLMIAPGLTGWAQVNGGTAITVEEKNALDEWYVRHASALLDLEILARTPWMMVFGDKRGTGAIAAALAEASQARAAAHFIAQ